jgi:plasmid maintenance system antidote protein VapI
VQTKKYSEIADTIGLSHRKIAKLAGVTPTTVDNVLNRKPAFSKDTEQRIHKVIETEAAKAQQNLLRLMGEA